MISWKNLLLPVGLGTAAAVLNVFAYSRSRAPVKLLVAKDAISQGEVFDDSAFESLDVRGDTRALPQTFVRYEDRHLFTGRKAGRSLQPGSLLLWEDAAPAGQALDLRADELGLMVNLEGLEYEPSLLTVGSLVSFVLTQKVDRPLDTGKAPSGAQLREPSEEYCMRLGPFRIVSIGERITSSQEEHGASTLDAQRTITVAIPRGSGARLDDQASKLVLAAQVQTGSQGALNAILLYPADASSHTAQARPQ